MPALYVHFKMESFADFKIDVKGKRLHVQNQSVGRLL